MKAKEYANKYRERLNAANSEEIFVKGVTDLCNELVQEMRELIEIRSIKTKESFRSLVKEFNVKANKISDLLNHILKRDWFITLIGDECSTIYKD